MMFGFLKSNRQESELYQESLVGCFGKLPIYDEFIRYNMRGRAILELDEWIQQGFSHHSRDMQGRSEKPQLHRCAYNFVFSGNADQPYTIMGTMMGSHDKCGRQYPFLLFKVVSFQLTEALTSTLPCAYKSYYENATTLCSTDWSLQPINMLKKRVEALNASGDNFCRSQLIKSELTALRTLQRKQFWRDMLGESAGRTAPQCIQIMHELLTTVVRKSPLRTAWGIQIPLPANDTRHVHVSFWVRVAETLLGSRGWRPHYIWGDTKNSQQQYLYLFFRPISPTFFSHLLGRGSDSGILINLVQESEGQHELDTVAKGLGDLSIDNDMVSITDELASWW